MSRPMARYTTGLGIRQIRPSSPSGAVSCDTAKPCAGCWLSRTSTVHSASAIGTSMSPSVAGPPLSVIRLTGAMARRHGWWRDRHARLAAQPGPVARPAGGTGVDPS